MTKENIRSAFLNSGQKSYLEYLENLVIEEAKKDYRRFMKFQKEEIEKYKYIQSQKAGYDLGNDCCIEWINKFAKNFKKWYFEN